MALDHHPETKTRARTAAPVRAPLGGAVDVDQKPPASHKLRERGNRGRWIAGGLIGFVATAAFIAGRLLDKGEARGPGGPDAVATATASPEAAQTKVKPVLEYTAAENEEKSPYRQIINDKVKAQAAADALGITVDQLVTSGESHFEGPKSLGGENYGSMWSATWKTADGTTLSFFTYPSQDIPDLEMARIPGERGDAGRAEIDKINQEFAGQGLGEVKIGTPYEEFKVPGAAGAYVDPTRNADSAGSLVFYDGQGYVVQATIRNANNVPLADEGQRLTAMFGQMAAPAS